MGTLCKSSEEGCTDELKQVDLTVFTLERCCFYWLCLISNKTFMNFGLCCIKTLVKEEGWYTCDNNCTTTTTTTNNNNNNTV